jgi:hypothetical protein
MSELSEPGVMRFDSHITFGELEAQVTSSILLGV